jgi:hypothetical protein
MKKLLLITAGLLLGAGIYWVQSATSDVEEISQKGQITSVLDMNTGDCLVGEINGDDPDFELVSCKGRFNIYVFTRLRYMHAEYMYESLKREGEKYCSRFLRDYVRDAGFSSSLVASAFLPKFFEWKGEFNSIKCVVHKKNFESLSRDDIGK